MTRLRLPSGLDLVAGVYDVVGESIDDRYIGVKDAGGSLDRTLDWNDVRDIRGVEIECARHQGQWWPTPGKLIPAVEVRNWRCPDCAWTFRQSFANRGGSPRF